MPKGTLSAVSDWTRVDGIAKAVLAAHDGVAPKRAFEQAGLLPRQIAAIHRRGVMERPRTGWYVDPGLPWQAKCAVRVGGVLSCASAVDSFGLPISPEAQRTVHVLLPGNAPRMRHSRDRRHYVVPGEDRSVTIHWSIRDGSQPGWRTSLVDALLALADCEDLDWWVGALDAALHRPRDGEPLLAKAEWAELVSRLPARLRAEIARVDPSAESILESLLRLAMLRRGIGPVLPQFWPDPAHRVDFLVGRRLLVEADGLAYHDPEKDRIRDAFLRGLGYVVLRFTSDRILHDMEGVLAEIDAALAAC